MLIKIINSLKGHYAAHKTRIPQSYLTYFAIAFERYFRTEEDIYTYLVGCPVTETAVLGNKHKKSLFELRTYLLLIQEQQRRQTQSSYFSAVSGPHWIHVEARFENSYIDYQDLIKLYIPLEYSDLYHKARTIFDYLFSLKKRFCYKATYKKWQDTLPLDHSFSARRGHRVSAIISRKPPSCAYLLSYLPKHRYHKGAHYEL